MEPKGEGQAARCKVQGTMLASELSFASNATYHNTLAPYSLDLEPYAAGVNSFTLGRPGVRWR